MLFVTVDEFKWEQDQLLRLYWSSYEGSGEESEERQKSGEITFEDIFFSLFRILVSSYFSSVTDYHYFNIIQLFSDCVCRYFGAEN